MRNMSFAMTTGQVLNQSKDVTRRFGWLFLNPGDTVQPVEKGMGLKLGEKIKHIGGPVRILSTQEEPLNAITKADCIREGFPEMSPAEFVQMLCRNYNKQPDDLVNRIEFEYLAPPNCDRNLFQCPNCRCLHFNVTNNGLIICNSYHHNNKQGVFGCGWEGRVNQ